MSALALARPQLPAPAADLPAEEKFNHLRTQLRAPQAQELSHSELEMLLQTEGRELLRLLFQAHLDERAPGTVTAPVTDADGFAHTPQRLHRRELESIFGTVVITRTGYGGRGLASLHPLDAHLQLPAERYSQTVRRHVAEGGRRAVL